MIGGILAAGLPFATLLLARKIRPLLSCKQRNLSLGAEVLLGSMCLATRSLLEEAEAVLLALESGQLEDARTRLSRIVGRDTENLNEAEISRAAIETLAESLSDGIIAPLFYLAIGGTPAALAYKSINTMDSMIGHREERYLYFGRAAARLDDVANYLPARISALLVCLAASLFPGTNARAALRTWIADGGKHKSPNAGQPESAMSGALEVRLGGCNIYDGEVIESPLMGEHFGAPSAAQVRTAIKVTAAASIAGCGLALLYLWRKHR